MKNKNILIGSIVVLLIAVGAYFVGHKSANDGVVGAIGTNPIENYVPAIKYNEGYYSELPVQTTSSVTAASIVGPVTSTATSTLGDTTFTSTATTSVKVLSQTAGFGGCIQINATSSATNIRLMFSPIATTTGAGTFAGLVAFQYGVCE